MEEHLKLPWLSKWWLQVIDTAEKYGSSAATVIDQVQRQHAFGLEVNPDGHIVAAFAVDGAIVVWIAVGKNARSWIGPAEQELIRIGRRLGMSKLRIEEGRKGWARLLPHWTPVGDDLELEF